MKQKLALLILPLSLFIAGSACAQSYPYGYDNDRYDRYDDLRDEQRQLERERDRLKDERERLDDEAKGRYSPPQESCPSGFHPGNHKCSDADRKRGCKDMKMPGGTTCNAGPFS